MALILLSIDEQMNSVDIVTTNTRRERVEEIVTHRYDRSRIICVHYFIMIKTRLIEFVNLYRL